MLINIIVYFLQVRTLDSILRMLNISETTLIDFLKIDIENSDIPVLKYIREQIPYILKNVKEFSLEFHHPDSEYLFHNNIFIFHD